MFGGRRRRPILGTALVMGVASSTAKHSVRSEHARAAQSQRDFDDAVQRQTAMNNDQVQRQAARDKEQERKTQEAIERALQQERERNAQQGQMQGQQQQMLPPSGVGNGKYCGGCGNMRMEGERFCPSCGTLHKTGLPVMGQEEPNTKQTTAM